MKMPGQPRKSRTSCVQRTSASSRSVIGCRIEENTQLVDRWSMIHVLAESVAWATWKFHHGRNGSPRTSTRIPNTTAAAANGATFLATCRASTDDGWACSGAAATVIDLRSRPLGPFARCARSSMSALGRSAARCARSSMSALGRSGHCSLRSLMGVPGLVDRLDALELGQLHQLGGAEHGFVGARVAARRVELVPGHRHEHPAAVDRTDRSPAGVQHRQRVLAGGHAAHELGQLRRGVDRGSAPSSPAASGGPMIDSARSTCARCTSRVNART